MLFNIEFWNKQDFLPTKRYRNIRTRYYKNSVDVDIKVLSEQNFPIAFIIHDYKSVYENAKNYDDFDGNGKYRMFDEEIRTFDGKLYKPVRITHGAAISTLFENLDYIKERLERLNREPFYNNNTFTENSIVKNDYSDEHIQLILDDANNYIIYNNTVWETCGEPMYLINTFGLGHNHGGTGFFIEYHYNSNINNKNYFNALERENAIAYGKQVALNRGDTNSVYGMGERDIIEVLMPEMVKRNPQKEHGNGDDFLNSLENMIENTDSSAEAGLLAVAMCLGKL